MQNTPGTVFRPDVWRTRSGRGLGTGERSGLGSGASGRPRGGGTAASCKTAGGVRGLGTWSTDGSATAPGGVGGVGGVRGLDPGECELAEQIVQTILPHFAVRNAGPTPRCVPHQVSAVLSLKLEVFAPPLPVAH